MKYSDVIRPVDKEETPAGNPIVRWLNRLQIHSRDIVWCVTSGREGAGAERGSVQRTVVHVEFFLLVFFYFCVRPLLMSFAES